MTKDALALALAGTLSTAGCITAQDQPFTGPAPALEYRLEPGTELLFTGSSSTEGSLAISSSFTLRVLVVRANEDGSCRVIARQEAETVMRGEEQEPNVTVCYCDMRPNGSFERNETTTSPLSSVFAPLPPASGWKDASARVDCDDTEYSFKLYQPREDEAGKFVLTCTSSSLENKIYDVTSERRIRFDPERGLPERIDLTASQGYGFRTKTTGNVELTEVIRHDDDEMVSLAGQMEASFAAMKDYNELIEAAQHDPENVDAAAQKAKAVLEAALAHVQLAEAREQIQAALDAHDGSLKYMKESAERFAKLRGKPSPEWTREDYAGNEHSIAGHRGKVIVLDFWYRGCGWCIKAMPQIKRLAEHYRDQDVVVLGMNTDRKPADAQFVIDTMELNYPTIKANDLPKEYAVQGFPTLVIIDQKGVVREFHVGYSPTLFEEVSKEIDGLLKGS